LTKWLYYIFGEPLLSGASHLAVPPWFWEGDAVVQETALSSSGRGRMPVFQAALNTIANSEKPFSYEKMVGGSYKDRVPDRYALGYALSMHGRQAYGNDFWSDVFKDATAYKSIFWPFSQSLMKRTGNRTRDIYDNMMKKRVVEDVEENEYALFESSYNPKDPCSYRDPKFQTENKLIAIKESMNREAYFVSIDIDTKKEADIIPVSFGMGQFDVNKDHLIWNEISSHPRWADVSFSSLYIHNFEEGKTIKLTKQSRLFSPDLSPDGKKILAIRTSENDLDKLIILDIVTGEIVDSIENSNLFRLREAQWLNEKDIVFVGQEKSQNAIFIYNLEKKALSQLLPFQNELIEYLSWDGRYIYFLVPVSERENQLFAIHHENKKVIKSKIKSRYPIQMPALSEKGKIAYVKTDFNQKSIRVLYKDLEMDFGDESEDAFRLSDAYKKDPRLDIFFNEEGASIINRVPQIEYESEDYKEGISKIKLHTWIPQPFYPNFSISLEANDALGNIGILLEPGYNSNERAFFTNLNLTYGAGYPLFDLGLSTLRNRIRKIEGGDASIEWDEFTLSGSVSLLLQYTRRNYYYIFKPSISLDHIRTKGYSYHAPSNFNALGFNLRTAAIRKRAHRSLHSKNSYELNLSLKKILNGSDKIEVLGNSRFYLPGVSNTHSTIIALDFRYLNKSNDYYFLNSYPYAGGYNPEISSDLISGLKLNYTLPLCYPDKHIGPFAFFKRIRMKTYYEVDFYGENHFADKDIRQNLGILFILDAKYFRLLDLPVMLGMNFINDEGDILFQQFRFLIGGI